MQPNLLHLENDMRMLLDELIECSREGEIICGTPPVYEQFEFVGHESDLTEEFTRRAMELARQHLKSQ